MYRQPTPSEITEVRRVKAMVAGASSAMNPQCFLGPTGPTGPTGPSGDGTQLASTVQGLGTSQYISTASLVSTTQGILDSGGGGGGLSLVALTSTVAGLGTVQYVSTPSLTSTVQGLGTSQYLSTPSLTSTVQGLGTAQYVSTPSLRSTVQGLGTAQYVSTPSLTSTVQGLGTSGYISSILNINVNSIRASSITVSSFYGVSTHTSSLFANTGYINELFVSSISTYHMAVYGANTLVVQGGFFTSSIYLQNNSLTYTQLTILNNQLVTTTNGQQPVVTINQEILTSTVKGLGSLGYISSATGGGGGITSSDLASTVQGLGTSQYVSSLSLVSTVQGLGQRYISSANTPSTVQGLGTSGYVSTSYLANYIISSIEGLGTAGYISTATGGGITSSDLASTVQGLGTSQYVSSLSLVSTVQGLGTAGYISSANTPSTVQGLGTAGYISTPSLTSTAQGLGTSGYVSTSYLANYIISSIEGLGTAGYISTATGGITSSDLASTVQGLGTAQYVSSLSLVSTVQGLGTAGYISSANTPSTVQGLGTAGYISTPSLTSTAQGLGTAGYVSTSYLDNYIISSIEGLGTAGYISSILDINVNSITASSITVSSLNAVSTYTSSINAEYGQITELLVSSVSTYSMTVYGANTLTVQGGFFTSSLYIQNDLNTFTKLTVVDNQIVTTTNGEPPITGINQDNLTSSIQGLGTAGYVSTSSDGLTTSQLNIINEGALFIAGGDKGAGKTSIQYSYDGSNWSNVVSGDFGGTTCYGIAYDGSSSWIAAGADPSGNTLLRSTDNGLNWTPPTSGAFTTQASGVAYGINVSGNGVWVAIGTDPNPIKYSTDGLTWQPSSFSPFIGTTACCIAYGKDGFGNPLWIVGFIDNENSANTCFLSSDGINWSIPSNLLFSNKLANIAYGKDASGNNRWVGVGASGTNTVSYSSFNPAATNGLTWNNNASGIWTPNLYDIYGGGYGVGYGQDASGNGLWVAIGNTGGGINGIIRSSDGVTWTNATTTVTLAGGNYLLGVTWNSLSKVWVATTNTANTLLYSTDGDTWTPKTSGGFNSIGNTVTNANPLYANFINTNRFSINANNVMFVNKYTSTIGVLNSNPQYTLDVSGSINATTAITLNGVPIITSNNLASTVQGLGTDGYISSLSLISTVEGLGTSGYISSLSLISTVEGLGTSSYISSLSLISTVEGLGTSGYISSLSLISTVEGLGTSGYISSLSLISTVEGLGTANYVSTSSLISSIEGLGTAGYVSTPSLSKFFMGNVLRVDAVNGNDSTASVGGAPYATVDAAIAAATSGTTIWILPGTYNLLAGITVPSGVAMRGLNTQTCIIQMLGVTANTTLLTMGENTRVEDLTMKLTSLDHYTLKGIVFGGTTTVTAKLRTCVLTIDNSAALSAGSSDVYAVECNGTGTLNSQTFSFNCLKGSTLNVFSNGSGNKRGILVSNTNVATTRDLNVLVAAPPTSGAFAGSYVGVETNDTNNLGAIQMRATTIGAVKPTAPQTYTSSDILQTTPATITNPSYLASAGVQIGPGTDLVTKSAGSKGFSTYIYPTSIYYGLRGLLSGGVAGYLWPGTQAVQKTGGTGIFPDSTTPAAYYRFQQPGILSGINIHCNIGPGTGHTTTFTVYRTPSGGSITAITNYTLVLSEAQTDVSYYNSSQDFAAGDLIHVGVTFTGGGPNTTTDITIQLDVF